AVREGEYAWRSDLKLRHYRVLGEAINAAAAKAAAGGKALTADQAAARDSAKSLVNLAALAASAGVAAGDTAPEIAADRANVILFKGYRLFSGSDFNVALRDAKLMPGPNNTLSDYRQAYTRAELEALRGWLKAHAASGKGLGSTAGRAQSWDEQTYLVKALDGMDDILRAQFGVAAPAAPRTVLDAAVRPGEKALAAARLALAIEARPRDAAFALEAEKVLFQLVAAKTVSATDAAHVLSRAFEAVRGTPSEAAALAAFQAALKGPNGAALAEVARTTADLGVMSVAVQAELVFPGFEKQVLKTGLRESDTNWRDHFKLRHYRALLAALEKKDAATKSATPAQRALIERARLVLPALESLGAAAGVADGDNPGDMAADILNPALQKGYADFPGSVFNEKLKEKGFLAADAGNGLGDRPQLYTRAQVSDILVWLKGVLASGQGWESDGAVKPLTDEEKDTLKEAIAAAEQALAGFPAAGKTLHGFAPLALAALPALAPWLIFTIIGLGAAYLAWKYLLPAVTSVDDGGATARESIPGAVIARHRRIELSARRMATAVNGGSFRSRFIGPGGTDFAEARPYLGEDMREIDWKTSAKKDELYAKKFELERDMPLMLVIDISRSGRFGTTGTDKRTAIEDAAAVLALAAAHSNVRVGAVLISDRVEQVFP
ncbi:MAG: DUF58 domain-containing protein, partial [Elusimicrobiota bacterium]